MSKPDIVTAEHMRQRLANTSLPADPTNVIELPGSQQWPPSLREKLQATLSPAGVLIPILERTSGDLTMLLTRRSAALRLHAGQISFPGGRMEPDDTDIEHTALRETHEEIGIASGAVEVVGYLPPMPTITGFAVTPIVGMVDPQTEARPDLQEVDFIFEVPLEFFLDPANRRLVDRELHGRVLPLVEYHYEEHRIWGATAMMIIELIKFITNSDL